MIKTDYSGYGESDRPFYHNNNNYEEPPIDYTDESDGEQFEYPDFYRSNDAQYHREQALPRKVCANLDIPMVDWNAIHSKRLIGQGGFAKVYQGVLRNKFVAVKEPNFHTQSSIKELNDVTIKEASLQFKLKHPNIIQLIGLTLKHERICMVLEYARGNSLRELLCTKSLSPNIIIRFAIQISSAMEYLHNFKPRAIIHRDLKSPNILLNEPVSEGTWLTKELKLTDLGLAREFVHSTQMTQCGTFAWMAPESINKSQFSTSSDVWGFGVVLWELLTGQIPYRNFPAPAIVYKIGNGKIRLPIPATCPDELKRIFEACWRHNPRERPSFSEIKRSLEQSSFNVLNLEQFETMKKNWQTEIEIIWDNLNRKEKQLNVREKQTRIKEEEIKRKEQIVALRQKSLEQREKMLHEKNVELAGREMAALMIRNTSENTKTKHRSSKKKFSVSGNQISGPKDFCHNFTITSSQDEDSLPILQAKALNSTWTPGTKKRPELHMNLFESSLELIDSDCDEEMKSTNEKQSSSKIKKKMINFVRKMFGSNSSKWDVASNDTLEEGRYIQYTMPEKPPHPLNRTYHGQTKHSKRQSLYVYEPFQGHFQRKHNDPDDSDSYDDGDETINKFDCEIRTYYPRNQSVHDMNNNNKATSSRYESPSIATTLTTVGTSKFNPNSFRLMPNEKFGDDLIQEYDRFEQEFQSMNSS